MKYELNGKELLLPDEINLDDDDMELIEHLLEEHWAWVSQIIYKIQHIRKGDGE